MLPKEGVVYTWVVEDPDSKQITDFCSFYSLPSSILNDPKYNILNAAYGYYCVAKDNDPDRLCALYKDLCILAKDADFDVFNVTEVMQHKKIIHDLNFKVGDGTLAHYLYNWRLQVIAPEEVGIILV